MNIHPLDSLIMQYLAEKDITRGSFELYDTILKQFTTYLKEHHILFAKTSDIINYRQWKRNQGYSTRWIYHQMSAIKGLYQYLKYNQKRLNLSEEYANDITELIKNERIKKGISKPILTIDQAKHLILCSKENRKYIWHYRDHAMLYLMLTTGMRSVELRRAKKKDLKIIENQSILYIQGKGRQIANEYVKITPSVKRAIDEYLKKRKDKNPYLFVSHSKHTDTPYLSRTFFTRMLKRVLSSCDLTYTKIKPHSLRHTAATFNLLRGGSLEQTKQFMRHTNISTTLVYAHHVKRLKDDSVNQIENYILNEDIYHYHDEYIIIDL